MSENWTPPSKNNPFCSGDVVIFRNRGPISSFVVDHVEGNFVFIKVTKPNGKNKLADYSANEFMLLSEWKRIYGKAV